MNYKNTYLGNSKSPQAEADKLFAELIKNTNSLKSRVMWFISLSTRNKKQQVHAEIALKLEECIYGYSVMVYSQINDNYFNVLNGEQKHKISRAFENIRLMYDIYLSYIKSSFTTITIPQGMEHKKNVIKKMQVICGIKVLTKINYDEENDLTNHSVIT